MRHRLSATFRAGNEIRPVILLLRVRRRVPANKARPLSPSASVAQHVRYPEPSARCPVARTADSRVFAKGPPLTRKKVFL